MKKLGKFEIISKVGQGAMGVVYKARDPFIDRIVALKTLTTRLAEDPHHLKRFYSEARSAGNLRHPNIVTIYELGHEGDTPFIAMQFLNGESLDKVIDRMPNLPLSQRVGFIVYVCRALEYAHKQSPPVESDRTRALDGSGTEQQRQDNSQNVHGGPRNCRTFQWPGNAPEAGAPSS
jgi:serine/threonine protein kinase